MDHQQPPDFTQPGFAALVNLIMAQGQFTREEALAALNQWWYEGLAGGNHPEEEAHLLPPQQHPQACPLPPEHVPSLVNTLNTINDPHPVTENPFNYDPKAQNETLTITQATEGNIAVQAANSLIASKNVKLDHHLSYAEYMFAKNHFLMAIENDTGEQGECTILQYASRATQKKAYNIGLINEELMTKIAQELDA
ncbi:hypothetical protein V8B97DRAFT_2022085 [Scleroderma yunnanense]